ncbi:uncharacterized protein EDB91DRAFT_1109400 [Suillus paluster]|uniref:uncharacterized protein n=1 Tax=Suillus paluster TaxID=48578 RepID=UPI001B8755BF|nr:uncharacterized protein EDB91DRAFT_1109400 [Suillus paluster]KAG1749735.1 hypothetical protein EDB91DRAFT_1109400 [Suillus paluster]
MFTIKATYRNETRKFSFPEKVLFPTYEELYHQLYRIFPISHNYYLSKLIFSPDASKPSRILIGKEVHTAEEYRTRIAPLRRRWPNPLLRFSIFDETPHKAPSSAVEDSQETSLPFMAIPPPPVLAPFNMSLPSPSPSLDTPFLNRPLFNPPSLFPRPLPSSLAYPIPPSFIPPPPPPIIFGETPSLPRQPSIPGISSLLPQVTSPAPCCSIAKGKSEIGTLFSSFRTDLDRIMHNAFGPEYNSVTKVDVSHRQTPVDVGTSDEAPPSSDASCNLSKEPPSSHWCFVCRNEFSGSWYGCVKCPWHFVCPSCFSKSGAMHTFSFGPAHVVRQRESTEVAPSITVTPSVAEVPAVSQSTRTSPANDAEPTQRTTIIHRNIVCDGCNEIIVGVRRKCLDCPDYDLCTPCIESGAAERHNASHEFFDIETPGRVFVHTVFSGDGERDASAASRSPTVPTSPRSSVTTSVIDPVHHCAACNMCDSPIVGDRFKCVNCPDFDTCADCFKITGEQHPNHGFVRVSKTNDLMMRNAVTNMVAHYATCDSCRKTIRGVRYKCMHPSCPDFDLCQDCEALPIPVHPPIHPLLKMKTSNTVVPTVYRAGRTQLIQSRRSCACQGNTPPQAVEPHPLKSSLASTSRVASEHSVKEEQEPPVVVPESLSPLAILAYCPEEDRFLQSSATNCDQSVSTNGYFDPVKAMESFCTASKLSAADCEQSTSPYTYGDIGELVQTIMRPSAPEVNSPSPDLNTSLDIYREEWPKVNREMKHLIEARQSEVPLSSPVAELVKALESDLVKLEEDTTLVQATRPEEFAKSLSQEVSPATPASDIPSIIDSLVFADRDLAALAHGYRTPSPIASEALAPSCTTSPSLDSILDEQVFAMPSTEQQQATRPSLSCAFVSDTTVPDGQIFPPGAEFVKSWRMSNDGERPWPETTELHFVAGEPFTPDSDSTMIAKVGHVDPGENLDVWTGDLKAPDAPGRYVGYWKLTDGKGESFGANIWIDVTVAEPRQSADEASDHSLASSSMVMPKSSSNNRSAPSVGPSGRLFEPSSPLTSKPATDLTDDGDSDGSSVSLVSVPSSDEYGSDWQDTRSEPENLEYVVLYDSHGSEDE